MNQNRLFVGVVILAVFMILAISGSVFLFGEWKSRQAGIGQRVPLPGLRYCAPDQARPCLLSIHLDSRAEMVIDLLIDSSLPDFQLQIRDEDGVNNYDCRKTSRLASSVACTGPTVPVGEVLQFLLLSKEDGRLLAEGQFPIIGLALATPEFASTPTFVPSWDRPPR